MATARSRRVSNDAVNSNAPYYDSGVQDITKPTYLVRGSVSSRRARVLSGRGILTPGYRIIGTQADAMSDNLTGVRVLKMVSPLTGQGPADPRATGYFAGMNLSIQPVRVVRAAKSVAPNTGSVVVRPPRTAVRRLDTKGAGTVSYV